MKAIVTKYYGPGNVKGSRITASDSDGNRVIVSYNYGMNSEQNHARAAAHLCAKMGWHGELIGGGTRDGMAWVFKSDSDTIKV